MGVKVAWTIPALDDLEEVLGFIAEDNPSAAAVLGRKAKRATRELRSFPRKGRMVPEYQNPDLRELIVGPVRIIYAILNGMEVQILATVRSERLLRQDGGQDAY